MDLQSWIEHLVSNANDIILCLDANEATYNVSGSYSPLPYTPDCPTVGKHDGSLATLARTCGLIDPLLVQHPDHPPPPTYSRGNNRIDYILISNHLLPAVEHTGILPFDSVLLSDHRPSYVDFKASVLFQDATPDIVPASRRGLQLQDPRIIEQYHHHLWKQLQYHK
jgi:hypothetical protein